MIGYERKVGGLGEIRSLGPSPAPGYQHFQGSKLE